MTMPLCWIAAGMLAVAVFCKMSYGYYQFLRFVVCGVAGLCTFKTYEGRKQSWLILAVAIALLFNPFVPVRFCRDTWQGLDVLAAVLIPIMGWKLQWHNMDGHG